MAPLLQPTTTCADKGGQSALGNLPYFSVGAGAADEEELPPHDASVLPHMHSDEDIAALFPTLDAPPLSVNVDDWKPEDVE